MAGPDIVLVFTMGRVGSSAVYEALSDAAPHVFHVHHMNPRSLARWESRPEEAARNMRDALVARRLLDSTDGRVQVVTLVRDAIDRNMSAAFASFRRQAPRSAWDDRMADAVAMRAFWDGFSWPVPLEWFDNQMREGLGIDAYAFDAPTSGHCTFVSGRFDVLVMRSELPNSEKSEVLSSALGRSVEVGVVNAHNRARGDVQYDRFRATAPLTREYVATVARSRYMQHFFDISEDEYVSRWVNT